MYERFVVSNPIGNGRFHAVQLIFYNYRIRYIRDNNLEMPDDFDQEIAKWALECEYLIS